MTADAINYIKKRLTGKVITFISDNEEYVDHKIRAILSLDNDFIQLVTGRINRITITDNQAMRLALLGEDKNMFIEDIDKEEDVYSDEQIEEFAKEYGIDTEELIKEGDGSFESTISLTELNPEDFDLENTETISDEDSEYYDTLTENLEEMGLKTRKDFQEKFRRRIAQADTLSDPGEFYEITIINNGVKIDFNTPDNSYEVEVDDKNIELALNGEKEIMVDLDGRSTLLTITDDYLEIPEDNTEEYEGTFEWFRSTADSEGIEEALQLTQGSDVEDYYHKYVKEFIIENAPDEYKSTSLDEIPIDAFKDPDVKSKATELNRAFDLMYDLTTPEESEEIKVDQQDTYADTLIGKTFSMVDNGLISKYEIIGLGKRSGVLDMWNLFVEENKFPYTVSTEDIEDMINGRSIDIGLGDTFIDEFYKEEGVWIKQDFINHMDKIENLVDRLVVGNKSEENAKERILSLIDEVKTKVSTDMLD